MTARIPTIWLVGVTRGEYPRSARTRGTSARTSVSRPSASCSASWERRFESIPPGMVREDAGVGLQRAQVEEGPVVVHHGLEVRREVGERAEVELRVEGRPLIAPTSVSVGGWLAPPANGSAPCRWRPRRPRPRRGRSGSTSRSRSACGPRPVGRPPLRALGPARALGRGHEPAHVLDAELVRPERGEAFPRSTNDSRVWTGLCV